MSFNYKIFYFIFVFIISIDSYGDNSNALYTDSLPEIGKPVPDFSFKDIEDYSLKAAFSRDFRGKWLFLDFWFKGCAVCITSMPKMDQLSRRFNKEAVFLLVGLNDKGNNKGIEELYAKLKQKKSLQIPHVFDSALIQKWDIHSMPHVIVVDPKGIVRAITDGRDFTEDKIKDLIAENNVDLYSKSIDKPSFDPAKIDASKLIYQSTLTNWNGEAQQIFTADTYIAYFNEQVKKQKPKPVFKTAMIPLWGLYNVAYTGNFSWMIRCGSNEEIYPRPIIKVKDTSSFEFTYDVDLGKGLYNYSLSLPDSMINLRTIMELMQQDLKRVFKYEASLEITDVPVWRLVIVSELLKRKLKSKGGNKIIPDDFAAGFTVKNFPANELIDMLSYYFVGKEVPFVDQTEMNENIDITMDVDMANLDDVRKGLRKYGLDLVKDNIKMKAVVIRDLSDKYITRKASLFLR